MALIRTPRQLHTLAEKLRTHVESEDFMTIMAGLLIPEPDGTKLDKTGLAAVQSALRWVARAAEIVSTGPSTSTRRTTRSNMESPPGPRTSCG